MKNITDSKELEFKNEYDSQLNVYYKGEPFSGILKKNNEEIEYKLGNAVHVIQYFDNGQKAFEEFLNNGAQLEAYRWYEDGRIKSEFKHDYLYFKEPGTVLSTGFSLYPNGKLESKSENGIRKSYSISGILIGESKWTPQEKYRKEYYLNGVLKYHKLPSINKSFHFTDKYFLVIDEDSYYGRANIYFDEIAIQTNIRQLFFSEGKENGYSEHADNIRINKLNSWLVSTIQIENRTKYLNLNFELCFCMDKIQAENAFKRLVNKLNKTEITNLQFPQISGIEQSEITKKVEMLKNETNRK